MNGLVKRKLDWAARFAQPAHPAPNPALAEYPADFEWPHAANRTAGTASIWWQRVSKESWADLRRSVLRATTSRPHRFPPAVATDSRSLRRLERSRPLDARPFGVPQPYQHAVDPAAALHPVKRTPPAPGPSHQRRRRVGRRIGAHRGPGSSRRSGQRPNHPRPATRRRRNPGWSN